MKSDIYIWLAEHLSTEGSSPDVQSIQTMLTKEHATAFLLVWPILEQELFDGFLTVDKIKNYANGHHDKFSELGMDTAVSHFHNRYQDRQCYKNLRYRGKNIRIESVKEINDILAKSCDTLNSKEKLLFLLYVTYRFRNNLFHGNKGILSWCQFEPEIDYCIQFMIQLITSHKNHN